MEIKKENQILYITFDSGSNALDTGTISSLRDILSTVLQDAQVRLLVFSGNDRFFCSGMDFEELMQNQWSAEDKQVNTRNYFNLLKELSLSSKVIVSCVKGQARAGGIGIIAASDYVISSSVAQFSLPELLFGLLPACVLPFLKRRIGYQKAFHLALMTKTLDASQALSMGLVDEISDDFKTSIRLVLQRVMRADETQVKKLKQYMNEIDPVTPIVADKAVAMTSGLLEEELVIRKIVNFMENQKKPWEENT